MRQGCVIEAAILLSDHHRLPTHLHCECLRHRKDRLIRGHSESTGRKPIQVHAHAGERHGRVDGQSDGAGLLSRG